MAEGSHPPPPITTTSIPSDPAMSTPPSAIPHPPPPPSPNTNAFQKLRVLILRRLYFVAHRTDRVLVRLAKVLSTPSGTDALLCLISYTLELTHALLSRILERRLLHIAVDIAEKAEAVLLPGESLVATLPTSTSTKVLAQTVGTSKALAGVIGDYRIFVRLWGLAGIYTWARNTWNAPLAADASPKEKVVRRITWAQIVSGVAFQVLENGAYLASKGALTNEGWTGEVGKRRETTWWVWSSRFWAAHVALEFVRLYTLFVYRSEGSRHDPKGRRIESKEKKEDEEPGEKEAKIKREERRRQKQEENWVWRKDLVSNMAYFPMTLHWSTETGFLSNIGVGVLGAIAGGTLFADAWRSTA